MNKSIKVIPLLAAISTIALYFIPIEIQKIQNEMSDFIFQRSIIFSSRIVQGTAQWSNTPLNVEEDLIRREITDYYKFQFNREPTSQEFKDLANPQNRNYKIGSDRAQNQTMIELKSKFDNLRPRILFWWFIYYVLVSIIVVSIFLEMIRK